MQGNNIVTDVYTRPTKELGARGGSRLIDHQIMNYSSLASRIDIDTATNHGTTSQTRKRFRGKLAICGQ